MKENEKNTSGRASQQSIERVHSRLSGGPEEALTLSRLHPQELRDRYLKVQEEFFQLKKNSIDQADELKRTLRTQTRVRKLENDLKREERLKPPLSASASAEQRLQQQKELNEFQASVLSQLSYRNEALERKLKMASVHALAARHHTPVLYRDVGPRVDTWLRGPPARRRYRTPPPSRPITPASPYARRIRTRSLSPAPRSVDSNEQELVVPESIRTILEEARDRIQALEVERATLHKSLERARQAAEEREEDHQAKLSILESALQELRDRLRECGNRVEEEATDAVMAAREVQSLKVQIQGFQERCKTAEEMLVVERDRRKKFISEIDELRTELQQTQDLLRTSEQECRRLGRDLEETYIKCDLLQQQQQVEPSRALEKQPEPKRAPLQPSEAAAAPLRKRIAELERAVQTELSEKQQLLSQLNESVVREGGTADQLVASRREVDKLRLLVTEARQRTAAAETALASRRHQAAPAEKTVADRSTQCPLVPTTNALLSPHAPAPPAGGDAVAAESLAAAEREKTAKLRASYEQKCRDLDEANAFMAEQAKVCADLVTKSEVRDKEFATKEKELLKKISLLEDALRDHRQSPVAAQSSVAAPAEQLKENKPPDSLSQSLKLNKKDCILEFYIDRAVFDTSAYDNQKTFVSWIMPFSVEDPLQHTDLAIGSIASYAHTSLYKIPSKALKNVQGSIQLEVYVLLGEGYPGKVGEATIPLAPVLGDKSGDSIPGTCVVCPEARGPEPGPGQLCRVPPELLLCEDQLGTLSYKLRLQRPTPSAALYTAAPSVPTASQDQLPPQQLPDSRQMPPMPAARSFVPTQADHKRRTSLRRKMQDYKYRNDSIHETEDEDDVDSYSALPNSESETESVYERNANLLLNNARQREQQALERESSRAQKDSMSRPTSSKKLSPASAAEEGTRSASLKDRPTSSKSSRSHKKRRKFSASSRSFHTSLEHLPLKRGEESLPEDRFKTVPRKKSSNSKRPHSAPRKEREASLSSSSTSSSSTETESKETSLEGPDQQAGCGGSTSSSGRALRHHVEKRKPSSEAEDSTLSSGGSGSEQRYSTDSEGVVAYAPKKKSCAGGDADSVTVSIRQLTVLSDELLSGQPGHKLFVSFHDFLPLMRKDLETPNSLPRPPLGESLDFNFKREYDVSERRHPERREALRRLLQEEDGNINFYLNSEPPDGDGGVCQELGVGSQNLLQVVDGGYDGRLVRVELESRSGCSVAALAVAVNVKSVIDQLRISDES